MKNIKRKLELYEHLFRTFGPGKSSCQVSQLADLWLVSERYVSTLIRTMTSEGWINWQASVGRNKKATIELLIEPIDACHSMAEPLANMAKVDELLEVLSFGGREPGEALQTFLNRTSQGNQQRIYIPFHRKIEPLNPHQVFRRTERFLVHHLYQRLTQINDGMVMGDLAYHWQPNEDATVWYFQLRTGITFHDGQPLSGKDIVRTLQQLISNTKWRGCYQHIAHIRAPYVDAIEITLHKPDWQLPRLLAQAEASIFKIGSAERLIGSGAFKLDIFAESMLRLTRSNTYCHQQAILDRIELWCYPEWAKNKACVHNEIRVCTPELTDTVVYDQPATFILIHKAGASFQLTEITVEDTSESQKLAQQLVSDAGVIKPCLYGHYDNTNSAILCSTIDENDSFSAWLRIMSRAPFDKLGISFEHQRAISQRLDHIRATPNLEQAQGQLEDLKTWLTDSDIMTFFKGEPFGLEVSKRLNDVQINGFGWCDLTKVWLSHKS